MTDAIRVLYVDDESVALRSRAGFLVDHDRIEVCTGRTVREGLETFRTGSVDCILSDLDLGRADGIDFLRTVREDHPAFPFILFTSRRSPESISRALDAGASDYVFKQSCRESMDLLVHRIEAAVGHYRTVRCLERYRQATDDTAYTQS
ncbi:MAG: response regulator [Natrinema limicola]